MIWRKNKIVTRIKPVGDQGLIVLFEQEISVEINGYVMSLQQKLLEADKNRGRITELIPTYASLTVLFDVLQTSYEDMQQFVEGIVDNIDVSRETMGKTIEIPVCYGGSYGEDLEYVANYHHLSVEEVIRIHSEKYYRIYMLGFLPGFPYLGGLDPRLETPRLASPRVEIPAGSVGIGGQQTGIYPLASPGGWQLIGRTPLRLFRQDSPYEAAIPIYQPGDRIHFYPIGEQEYRKIREAEYGDSGMQ